MHIYHIHWQKIMRRSMSASLSGNRIAQKVLDALGDFLG